MLDGCKPENEKTAVATITQTGGAGIRLAKPNFSLEFSGHETAFSKERAIREERAASLPPDEESARLPSDFAEDWGRAVRFTEFAS